MEEMFKLSRRRGSAKWQVRKRWPSDVAHILKGEFTASTGEEDKKRAQENLALIVAEYNRRVREARDKLAKAPRGELSNDECHRMAVQFFEASLPSFVVRRALDPAKHSELLRDAKERLGAAQASLGRNSFGAVAGVSRTMVEQAGLDVPDDHPSYEHLQRMLMRAFVELHRAAVAHLEGAADYRPEDSAMREIPASEEAGRTVADLITEYEAEKSPKWSGSTKKGVAPVFRFLREVFPGRQVASITRADAKMVRSLLEELPANMGKRKELEGLTVPQAIVKGRALGLPKVQPKTINDGYLIHIAAVFNWARREQWIAASPFEGLQVHDPVSDLDRRDPFTVDQLNKLFASAPWDAPWNPERKQGGGAFWVPLLCLYHGLRNGEAGGLRVEDIDEEDGVTVLHVREYGQRKLKTRESRRTLPVHPELIRLGFLEYVQHRREAGAFLLFPEGVVNDRGQVAAKLGERFSARVKAMDFDGRKLGMHSFRHGFEDRLRAAELPERTALALAGRSEAGSSRSYGEGVSTKQKADC
ncbi:site-specific integrase [Sphingobium sp. DEHP117]|uniref:site-specific integrase n=1 Tax=Sphingobium sp. DEHP117 TaxID=2993436 RepID=UPI0027D6BA73|nr:tyrosine-type recombinase/integrase [Sphingobium sp. DEHP117]MDQ4420062.1 site-specific integrase [Sphingobium sp. DEHP117]